jgi:hypothetical protein
MGRLVVAAMVAASVLGQGTAVRGAPPNPDDSDYYQKVIQRIERVRRAGGSSEAVDRMLEREFGWLRVAGDDDGTELVPLGTPSGSDVNLPRPTIYRNVQAARFEVTASWQWRMCGSAYCWAANYGGAYGSDGGPDGFGVASNIALNSVSTAFATFNNRGAMQTYANPDAFDDYGAGFSEQDRRYYGREYTWDHGLIVYGFNIRTCVGMQGTQWTFRSRMSHTWGDTGVVSITLSAGVIGFSFSNASSSRKWQAYGTDPLRWYPCG